MKLYKAKNYYDLSRKAANIISAYVIIKPNTVLGLATGSTPIGTYKQLIDWYKKDDINFSNVKAINLDEYKSLGAKDKQSYAYFMKNNFFKYININEKNCYIPNGNAKNTNIECKKYDSIIEKHGPIDLQLLGIGENGHIGFNEPGISFDLNTHLVKLSNRTIDNNKRFFGKNEKIPTHAFTLGMKGIMQAKAILLIVSGKNKKDAIKKAFSGPITPEVPASILQMHNNVTVIIDNDAY